MELLKEWIRNIVVFILLATLLEFLIPSNGLGKYIKFTTSLLLIILLINPLFKLFSINVEQVLQQNYFPSTEVNGVEQNLLEKKKIEIQDGQRAYILEQMAVQLKRQVAADLKKSYDVTIVDATVDADVTDLKTYPKLKGVTLTLVSNRDGKEKTIEAVKSVNISASSTQKASDPNEHLPVTKIQKYLSKTLGLKENKINIKEEGGFQS